mgnify:CR=1 FL=1
MAGELVGSAGLDAINGPVTGTIPNRLNAFNVAQKLDKQGIPFNITSSGKESLPANVKETPYNPVTDDWSEPAKSTQAGDILKQFDEGMLKNRTAREDTVKKFAGQRDELTAGFEKSLKEIKDFAAKGPVKEPEKELPKFTPTEIQSTMGLVLALAAFSGVASRAPLTASMNALAGMVEGVNKGDAVRFDREYKEWDANMKLVNAHNKAYLEKYNSIMDSMKLSISEKTRLVRQLDVEEGRELQLHASNAGDIANRAKLGASMLANEQKLEHAQQVMEQRKKEADDRHQDRLKSIEAATARAQAAREAKAASKVPAIGGPISPTDVMSAWTVVLTGKAPGSLYSYDKEARQKLRDATAKVMADAGINPMQAAMIPVANASTKTALAQQVQREAAVAVAQEKLIKHGEYLVELVSDLGHEGSLVPWNQLMVYLEAQTNNPKAVTLREQLALFGNEFARLSSPTSNAMLPEGARNESRELLKTGFNTATMREVVKVLERDAEISHAAFKNERDILLKSMLGGINPNVAAAPKPAGAPETAKQAPDGKWYSPDPARPGKYILHE